MRFVLLPGQRHDTVGVRPLIEGVAFGLRDGLDLMLAAGLPQPHRIRASGGGIASPLWRSILADVLETEIATVSTTEGAAYGAAVLASVGAGWFPDVDTAVTTLVRITPVATPGADSDAYRAALGELGAVYRRHLGRHYVATALFEVAGLFDPAAKVELVGIAVVPDPEPEERP